jgi:hypothetical protein
MARPIATRCRCPPESLLDPLLDLGLAQLRKLQREGEIVAHRHVRIERIGLEHHRNAAVA